MVSFNLTRLETGRATMKISRRMLLAAVFSMGFVALCGAAEKLEIRRVVAIVTKSNEASVRVLHKLGFQLEGPIQLSAGEEELHLFASAM